jgi:uncharacterized tellurite resistance protein B-like protein
MSNQHLNILVQLAQVDGEVADVEKNFLYKIAEANSISKEEVDKVFENPGHVGDLSKLSDDQKYEYVYSIVQMMKIDGKLYHNEIKYCSNLAAKLGYDPAVIFELIIKIASEKDSEETKQSAKENVQSYLVARQK